MSNGHSIIRDFVVALVDITAFWLCVVIALLYLLAGCGKHEATEKIDPSDEARAAHYAESIRIEDDFSVMGQVVSRDGQEPYHLGDSRLFTGLYLGSAPCDLGAAAEASLIANIDESAGFLTRFTPLPAEYVGGREASLDTALGVYWGAAFRAHRCGSSPALADAIRRHRDAVRGADGQVFPGAGVLTPEFSYVLDRVSHALAGTNDPDRVRLRVLETEVAAWASAVKARRAACFRAHLGFLALSAVEAAGDAISVIGRAAYCDATDGLDLPIVDHWCGRPGLVEYMKGFTFDTWEYRHQRCPAWEDADGNGLRTPGVDKTVADVMLYDL